jgi:hypothetical protein
MVRALSEPSRTQAVSRERKTPRARNAPLTRQEFNKVRRAWGGRRVDARNGSVRTPTKLTWTNMAGSKSDHGSPRALPGPGRSYPVQGDWSSLPLPRLRSWCLTPSLAVKQQAACARRVSSSRDLRHRISEHVRSRPGRARPRARGNPGTSGSPCSSSQSGSRWTARRRSRRRAHDGTGTEARLPGAAQSKRRAVDCPYTVAGTPVSFRSYRCSR